LGGIVGVQTHKGKDQTDKHKGGEYYYGGYKERLNQLLEKETHHTHYENQK
jgi:hypothetical protein